MAIVSTQDRYSSSINTSQSRHQNSTKGRLQEKRSLPVAQVNLRHRSFNKASLQTNNPKITTDFKMFNGKLSTFNMLTIPFLLISAASSTPLRACSSTNARSLGSFQESSIQVRDDGPFCHPQPPGRCTLSITAGQPREWAAVANYACVPIGGWYVNGIFDLASQLKYKVDGDSSPHPHPSFCYAGECHGPDDPCWYVQYEDDEYNHNAIHYCQFTCSQG
ncbi:hypothetical protein ACMFMG_002649 [Clarireedia jacksonii]